MENEGLLDIGNDVHLFALRYVFKERINSSLKVLAEGWNHHLLSTEGNMSPAQLWVWGLRQLLIDLHLEQVNCDIVGKLQILISVIPSIHKAVQAILKK